MAIKYRILKFHPEEHSVMVRYYSDELTEHDLRTDPNDPNDPPIQCRTDHFINIRDVETNEEALYAMICRYAPIEFFDIHTKIKNPNIDTTMSKFEHLKNKEMVVEKAVVTPELTPEDIDDMIEKINTKNIHEEVEIGPTKKKSTRKRAKK